MLRGRGHLPHRPSRCFPTARSQLHRLWTRRELEKTKEPRRPGSQVHSIFETVRHFSKTKLYTFLYRKKDIRIFLQVFFSIAPEKKEGISFFIWIYFSPKGLRFNPSQEHVSQSHWTPWNRNGIVATCATLANPKD